MDARVSATQGPLKVLFLTDCPLTVSGGSERFLRNLANGLAREQFAVSVIQLCNEPPAAARVHEHSVSESVETGYLACDAVYGKSGMRAYRALRRKLMHEGFHVVQSQHENADFLNALLPRGPLGAIRISNRRDTGFLKSPRLRFASRFLNHRYDHMIAPTRAVLEAVAASEGRRSCRRMICIPNGVDSTRFRPVDPSSRQRVRHDLGLPSDALLIGCVADLFAVKRHLDLVEAFARLSAECPRARLLLIGEGPLRDVIETRIRDLRIDDRTHVLGSRSDIDVLLPALDLFVLASDTEGLSNAILEAQACGLPVVATRVGGNPDLVHDDCGVLVPARDPNALADAIITLLRNPDLREKMGAAARAAVVRDHSLDSMTQAYASLYRELVHVR